MEQTNYVIYGDTYEFEDVILTSFRYSLYRKTYVVEEITSWIKHNSHLMDGNKRMYDVMMRDVNECLQHYETFIPSYNDDIDYNMILSFKNWLVDFGKGYGWNVELKGE